MSHTIAIHLSEQAQRAALLEGADARAYQFYPVPLELLARLLALPWTSVDVEGVAACEVPLAVQPHTLVAGKFVYADHLDGRAPVRPADVAAAVAHGEAVLAACVAEQGGASERERAKEARKFAESESEVARQRALAALLDIWESDHSLALEAGALRNAGPLVLPLTAGRADGDGYNWGAARERYMALRHTLLAAAEAEAEQKKAARAAERAAQAERVRAWVSEHAAGLPENIRRAAAEGRDVAESLRLELLARADEALGDCSPYGLAERCYSPQVRGGVPSEDAYAALDALIAAGPAVEAATLGAYRLADSGEDAPAIVRADVSPENGQHTWRTGARGVLVSPFGLGEIVELVLAEPLEGESEDDDE